MYKIEDNPEHSDALVLFGVTGDLARKKIFPALYAMARRGALNVPVIGVASSKLGIEELRRRATGKQSANTVAATALPPPARSSRCSRQFSYVSGNYPRSVDLQRAQAGRSATRAVRRTTWRSRQRYSRR